MLQEIEHRLCAMHLFLDGKPCAIEAGADSQADSRRPHTTPPADRHLLRSRRQSQRAVPGEQTGSGKTVDQEAIKGDIYQGLLAKSGGGEH